jgi:hypothetical protein
MLGVIETLLDDGVLIFEEDLNKVEILLEDCPYLITDIIKLHEFASQNRDIVIAEYIYPTENNRLVYELATFSVEDAIHLTIAIDKLGIRSKNLVVGVAYPKEVDIDEGD